MVTRGYCILAELNLLRLNHPSGVYVFPDEKDLNTWHGIISVRSGYYIGGVFSFRLELPIEFPRGEVPRLFLPKGFFHPYVNLETGEVITTPTFTQWNPEQHHLWHLLHHLRALLTSPTSCLFEHSAEQFHFLYRSSVYVDPSQSSTNYKNYANPEAAELLINNRSMFEKNVKRCLSEHSVLFALSTAGAQLDLDISGWDNDSFINRARRAMNNSLDKAADDSFSGTVNPMEGHSWIDAKTMRIFANEAIQIEKNE